jgi:hypothetical protein
MKPSLLLSVSAGYLALVGLGFLFAPDMMMFGALGTASVTAVATLRGLGGTLLSVGVMNWVARNAEASKARDAIFMGNTLGFALAAITQAIGLLGGAPAPGWLSAGIDALIAIAFFMVGRTNMAKA